MKPLVPHRGKNIPHLYSLSHSVCVSLPSSSAVYAVNLSPTDIKERHRGRDITGVESTKHRKAEYCTTGKRRHAVFQFTSISDLFKPAVFHLSVLSSVFHSIYSLIYLFIQKLKGIHRTMLPTLSLEVIHIFFGLMRMCGG